ncbi:MAG: VWA domain-containing protein [Myxococcales bacterium]|nr:VWA domain-containing protein [Myxococcales bacterium]
MVSMLGCVVLAVFLAAPPPKAAQSLLARVELAAGEVRQDSGRGARPALSGAALAPGTRLRTGPGARALVRLSDGSAVFLRDKSEIVVAPDALTLQQGEAWLDTPPTERGGLLVQAGAARIFASDAGLSVSALAGGAQVYVARGLATVSAPGGRVDVHAGEQAQAPASGEPKVAPVAYWEDWTGGLADHPLVGSGAGAGQIFGVDPQAAPGTPAARLEVARQAVRVVIRAGLAETEVDQTFFNPSERPLEGWYWFTLPAGASVTGFAVEQNGALIEGEFIERREAAARYTQAASSGHAPALLEWLDGRSYRSRIFPVPAGGSRRVVLRYLEVLPDGGGELRYLYPMQSADPARIGEFSLNVDLGDDGRAMDIATLAEARVEDGGRRVTLRRSGYLPRSDFVLEARLTRKVAPLRLFRFSPGEDAADYVLLRYVPDVEWPKIPQPRGEVVLVVDTSAGGDDAARSLQAAAARAILRSLSEGDRFALMALDVRPVVLFPTEGLAPASEENISAALKRLAEHPEGGATDLSAMFDAALSRLYAAEQPAVIYIGDGQPTSGELSGARLVEGLERAMATSRARFFAVGVGPRANGRLLSALAAAGGGAAFEVGEPSQVTGQALALVSQLKTPAITEFSVDLGAGLDEVFENSGGKLKCGDEVLLLARTHSRLPDRIRVRGRLAGQPFAREYPAIWEQGVVAAFVPRLWAAEYIRRLLGSARDPEEIRGKVMQLGIGYGLMTPFTSILALESEAAYAAMGIARRWYPLRGLRLAMADRRPEVRPSPLATAASPAVAVAPTPPPVRRAPVRAERVRSAPVEDRVLEAEMARPADDALAAAPATSPPPGGPRAGGAGPAAAPPPPAVQQVPDPRLARELAACSDIARRPLSERVVVWQQRLRTARNVSELLGRYISARQSCELSDWASEATFLYFLQQSVQDEGSAREVLAFFKGDLETQRHLARLILRRTLDPRITAVAEKALFGGEVNWAVVDGELAKLADPEKRLQRLREVLTRSGEDPNGLIRLAQLLAQTRRLDEAALQLRRIRDAGLATPFLSRELGSVLASQERVEEAVRSYSEIVEFDPLNRQARRLLGDILLAHGWYDPAYRQFRTLTEDNPDDALGWLRLASAAAGAGRVDEALRIERQVAAGAGRPGTHDPRLWARMLSAARLARLLSAPAPGPEAARAAEGQKTRLKELKLFRGTGTLVLVTWEDAGVDLRLGTMKGAAEAAAGQPIDGSAVGLTGLMLSPGEKAEMSLRLFVRSPAHNRPIALRRQDITWDGRDIQVAVRELTLPAGASFLNL